MPFHPFIPSPVFALILFYPNFRALKQSQCKNSHTYILVAFDMGETGTQGSNAFVNDFLVRMILRPQRYPEIQVKSNFYSQSKKWFDVAFCYRELLFLMALAILTALQALNFFLTLSKFSCLNLHKVLFVMETEVTSLVWLGEELTNLCMIL